MTTKIIWRRARPAAIGIGLAAAVTAALTIGLMTGGTAGPAAHQPPPRGVRSPHPNGPGPAPAQMALVSYTNCDAMLAGLREHTAAHVGPDGLFGNPGYAYDKTAVDRMGPVPMASGAASEAGAPGQSAPAHSTTNVQEVGVGEPDIVDTDGNRIVSVSNGVLRVVDAATHEITGSLDLTMYAGAQSAQLLMSGDRVLVLLGDQYTPDYYGGPAIAYGYPYRVGSSAGSTFLLVDLSGSPHVVSTLHSSGAYLDARMVGDTARLVVQTSPTLTFPVLRPDASSAERTAHNRAVVRHAPLSSWLPRFSVTSASSTTSSTVPCTSVSHPVHYTGASMLTVYTVNLTGDLSDPQPISLAADGTSVYASTSSLYVASERYSSDETNTQLHRFDITGAGKPVYLGSGFVPGTLLNSYSMSEYDGALRVVTTKYSGFRCGEGLVVCGESSGPSSDTSVYAMDADTLAIEGHVDGLGRGEQVHAVRFLGPLAYVVTFRSVDPLYVIDLHDPANPKTAGELSITGYSDYLHPVADGRLLGVGEDVNSSSIVTGLQVSLFDVTDPTNPSRLDRVTESHSPSETPIDPHAFLYWPASHIAVVPIDSWNEVQSGAALVVHVGTDNLSVVGTIRNPAVSTVGGYGTGIERTLVVGSSIWTMSSSGLRASDVDTLDKQAWVPFD